MAAAASRGGALVTGAARRIGRALALGAADAGHDVAVHCRASEDEAQGVADEIRAMGRRACVVHADLADETQTAGLVDQAVRGVGPLTLLVNNASTFQDDRVGDLARASWDLHMEANLRAPVVLAEAFARQVPEGVESLVVNILDQRVWRPEPHFFSYGVSKAGLWAATQMMAQALAPRIRVNAIGPGPTLANYAQSEEDFAAEAAATLMGRRAEPQDIVHALRYLLDARSVTGQMIAVDAGQHLQWKHPN